MNRDERIKKFFRDHGHTQLSVAALTKVNKNTVGKWVAGTGKPDMEHAYLISLDFQESLEVVYEVFGYDTSQIPSSAPIPPDIAQTISRLNTRVQEQGRTYRTSRD